MRTRRRGTDPAPGREPTVTRGLGTSGRHCYPKVDSNSGLGKVAAQLHKMRRHSAAAKGLEMCFYFQTQVCDTLYFKASTPV